MDIEPVWIVPPEREVLRGEQPFEGLGGSTVSAFWQFALGDLRMNNARGYLAEFIVAKSLGLEQVRRVEWDAYDILWEGIAIEVKSSAYLQAWDQRRLSDIRFGGLKGTRFHPRHDLDPLGKRYNAQVYVFCVQTAKDHNEYDPLNIDQWEFFVVPRTALAATAYNSIGLSAVASLSNGPTTRIDLKEAVMRAAVGQSRSDDAAEWWL
jgi:hypothetical protein